MITHPQEYAPVDTPASLQTPTDGPASLPAWTAPFLLAALAAFTVLIATIGWLAIRPNGEPAFEHASVVPVDDARALPPAPLPPAPTPASAAEPKETIEPSPPAPAPIVLQRRMPTGDVAAAPPAIPLMPDPTPLEPSTPIQEFKSPGMLAPLRWSLEQPPAGAANLMMPIETARVDDAKIPHTLRRLQLPESALRRLKLAVTPVVHDDVGAVLTRMGDGYRFTRLRKEALLSLDVLKKFDVVFLTCADLYVKDFQAVGPLRKFVAGGGTLYASDLQGDMLLATFPEFRGARPIAPGLPQTLEATVTDPGLRAHLARAKIPLTFDAPSWRPAPFDPNKVSVGLEGSYRNNLGQTHSAPLLVKFPVENGSVIFTSFHHTPNDSAIVRKLLEYLVFTCVNARAETRVLELMHHCHFAPREIRPALLTVGKKVDGTHKHNGGGLQFALGFEPLGARLKLTLRSPAGQIIEHTDQNTYLIEISKANAGAWTYQIEAIDLPYANFPVLAAIGATKS